MPPGHLSNPSCPGCSHKRGFEAKQNYPVFWFKQLQFVSKQKLQFFTSSWLHLAKEEITS